MAHSAERSPAAWLRQVVHPLTGSASDLDGVLAQIDQAPLVLLGEASHGTHEFYALRARLTQRLIVEKGFRAVAIEGDWPDAAMVNRFVRGGSGTATEALAGFRRFPAWMWRNPVVLNFVNWLRAHNDRLGEALPRVGFYGLDLYCLYPSMSEVLRFLDRVDPLAARMARERYHCFMPYGEDTERYALQAHYLDASCEEEVVATLLELQRHRAQYAGQVGAEATFEAELNAMAAVDSEQYYRHMIQGDVISWNLRDQHMVNTLHRIRGHLDPDCKVVLWAHNTHLGDFRATREAAHGYLNVGQLLREQFGDEVVAIGFGTHHGTVTAAAAWDGAPEFKAVPPARAESYEDLFHRCGVPQFYLPLATYSPEDMPARWLFEDREERAIGVVYHPERERYGNYLRVRLANRYDGYFFLDETLALEPLDLGVTRPGLETYPSGL